MIFYKDFGEVEIRIYKRLLFRKTYILKSWRWSTHLSRNMFMQKTIISQEEYDRIREICFEENLKLIKK